MSARGLQPAAAPRASPPPPPGHGLSGGTVSYEDAVASLRAMFPDADPAGVEAALEANGACGG